MKSRALVEVGAARDELERLLVKAGGREQQWQARWAERRADETRLQLTVLRALHTLSRSMGSTRSMALLGRRAWDGATREQALARVRAVVDGRLPKDLGALAEQAAAPVRDTVDRALDSAAAAHRLPVQKQSFYGIEDMHNLLREENSLLVSQALEDSFAGYGGDLAATIVAAADPANPMTMVELSRQLENSFLKIDRKRAMLIARTESARVYGNTTYEFYKNADFKEYRWATAAGSPSAVVCAVCTYCQALAAQGMQQISSGFRAEAMVGVLHPRRVQFGAKFPPYHPKCRCDIIANTKGWLPPAWMVNVPQQLTPTGPGMMQAVVQGGRAAQRQVVMQEIQKLRYGNLVKHVGFNNELGARTLGDSFTIPKIWGSNVPITQAQIENVVRHETGHVVWNSVLTKEQESEWIKVADELGFGPESRLAGERMRYLREGMAKGWSDDKFAGEFFAEAHNWYEAGGADRAFLKEMFPKQFREIETLFKVEPVVPVAHRITEAEAKDWLMDSVNKEITLHNTTEEGMASLLQYGVDIDKFSTDGLFGKGFYSAIGPRGVGSVVEGSAGDLRVAIKVVNPIQVNVGGVSFEARLRELGINPNASGVREALLARGYDGIMVTLRSGERWVIALRDEAVRIIR